MFQLVSYIISKIGQVKWGRQGCIYIERTLRSINLIGPRVISNLQKHSKILHIDYQIFEKNGNADSIINIWEWKSTPLSLHLLQKAAPPPPTQPLKEKDVLGIQNTNQSVFFGRC